LEVLDAGPYLKAVHEAVIRQGVSKVLDTVQRARFQKRYLKAMLNEHHIRAIEN